MNLLLDFFVKNLDTNELYAMSIIAFLFVGEFVIVQRRF